MFRFLYPYYRFHRITEITREWLDTEELFALLLDVDSTIKYYHSDHVLPEIQKWIVEMKDRGINFGLLSNGREKRISRIADELDLPFIAPAYKPLPFACRRIIRELDFDPQYTGLIGDQLFTDILGANLSGIRSILVNPLHPEEEPFFARIKRPFERFLLKFDKTESMYSD